MLGRDGLEQVPDVVAERAACNDPADEPVRRSRRGSAVRAVLRASAQRANLSISSPVSPPNSWARSRPAAGTRWTARWSAGERELVGAVLVREAGEKARRVDADLGGEADQAAVLLIADARRDDEHRIVEHAHQLGEGRRRRHSRNPSDAASGVPAGLGALPSWVAVGHGKRRRHRLGEDLVPGADRLRRLRRRGARAASDR